MNNLDLAIALLEDAKQIVRKPKREIDIKWSQYENNLITARRLIKETYGDSWDDDLHAKIAKQLRKEHD